MNQPIENVSHFLSRVPVSPDRFEAVHDQYRSEPVQAPALATGMRAVMLRKWWILGFVAICTLASVWFVITVAPVYRSTVTVLLEASKLKVISVDDVYTGASANREYFQTQAEAIKSRDVAVRVVRKLGLIDDPEFDPRRHEPGPVRKQIDAWIAMFRPPADPVDEATRAEAQVVRDFGSRLNVELVRNSQLVRIAFDAHDAQLAARIANEIALAFINADIEARLRITQGAGTVLNDRLAELKSKLDASERAVQVYRETQGLIDHKAAPMSGEGRRLDDLTQLLVQARVRRSDAEAQLNQVKRGEATGYESVPAVVKNFSVQRARDAEADAEKKAQELVQRFGEAHPQLLAARAELGAARAYREKQIQTIVQSMQREYDVARATERTIEQQLEQAKSTIQGLTRKEIQLQMLEREAESNRKLYQTFVQRAKETDATSDVQPASARVIDMATASIEPIYPAKSRTVALSAALALALSVLVAIARKQFNTKINSSDEVESKLQVPLLAAVPILHRAIRPNAASAVIDAPGELFSEALRTAATGIVLSTMEVPRRVIALTSSLPGEGKSTLAINLALWQARSGKRTILIEGDMRQPRIARALRLPDDRAGLSDVIQGQTSLADCVHTTERTGLDVLAAGGKPVNALELLVSDGFRRLLHELREDYEVVIFDTPPLQLVSDALVIGKECTGLVYVVKAGGTSVTLARKGLRRLTSARIPVLGVLLNQLDYRKAERYYGEDSGYVHYGDRAYGYGRG